MNNQIGVCSIVSIEPKRKMPNSRDWQGLDRFDEHCLPFPTVLLGSGTALWDNVKREICPACRGRELASHELCLRCDRWGLDYLLQARNKHIKVSFYEENKDIPLSHKVKHS